MLAVNLKCNSSVNPLGVETPSPRFSWMPDTNGKAEKQAAYNIIVVTDIRPGVDATVIWNSGIVESDASIDIPYAGKRLSSSQSCRWKVRLRNENGEWSPWSCEAVFEMGLLSEKDWKARFICSGDSFDSDVPAPAPYFRKTFTSSKKISKARAYICGLGYFELHINGMKISEDLLAEPFTRYDKTVMYCTYDITEAITDGKNAVGVVLGNGWFNCFTSEVWDFKQAAWRNHPMLLLQLSITYEDGSAKKVCSDTSFKVSHGPITFDGLRNGEHYDARLEIDGWDMPCFDDSCWENAKISMPPGGELHSAQLPPIRLSQTLSPVSMHEVKPGTWVFDLGQNISGWALIKITAEAGQKITLRYAEKLLDNGDIDASNINAYVKSGDFQTDTYIAKGAGTETWEPGFTYHGFRYVQVTGMRWNPETDRLYGRVVHTALESRGEFSCSSELLNSIQKCARWSTLTNYHGIPTDCPHREKNGWTGDAMVSCDQVLLNFNPVNVYIKWMRDFKDAQRPSGQLPGIVPTGGWGYNWGSGPAWDSAIIAIPWNMYVYCGNKSILEEMYPYMLRYADYMTSMSEGYLVDFGLGDWCPPYGGPAGSKCPVSVTSSGYYYSDTVIMQKVSKLLGKQKESARLGRLAEKIKKAFNETFISADGTVLGNCQTSMASALYQGLVYDKDKPKVLGKLVEQVELKNRHIDCGMLGAKYVMHTLSDYGRTDLACAMAMQTDFPGWGNWIIKGATTLWETWNGDSSLNHHMFSDISAWFYRDIAGLRPDPEQPGFRHTIIRPGVACPLESASASHESPYGAVAVGWEKHGDKLTINTAIPTGCTATVYLPYEYSANVTAKSDNGGDIDVQAQKDGASRVELSSGKYKISAEKSAGIR